MTLERAAERCINVLLDLIKQKVNYVVQEAVVVITDIFRRYPNRCCPGGIALQVGCLCRQMQVSIVVGAPQACGSAYTLCKGLAGRCRDHASAWPLHGMYRLAV